MFQASLAQRQEFRNCVCSLLYSHVALYNDRQYNLVYGAMVIVIQYNVDVYVCGLRDLVPLVGILSVFVIVCVYAGGPSAVVFLLGCVVYWFLVWDCIRSVGGNFGFCAVDLLRLGLSYSSVAARAYVIMGGVQVAPLVGMVCLLL